MFGALNKVLKKIVGDKSEKDLKEIQPYVGKINAVYDTLQQISSDELRERVDALRTQINARTEGNEKEVLKLKDEAESLADTEIDRKEEIYEKLDQLKNTIDEQLEEVLMELLPEAFAIVKETARRWAEDGQIEVTARQHDRDIAARRDGVTIEGDKAIWSNKWMAAGAEIQWNMVHYDVQLIGGVALHTGKIAEMQTGEGKTLVSTLPVFLNALTGKGVHMVTVNDYLARRDAEWMGPLHEFHGMTVDCIDRHQPNTEERRNAYRADITYGTNNGFGFDYLRDNMAKSTHSLVMRKLHYAIVDEVDSVLIDEARTPLIISGPTPRGDVHEFDVLKPRVNTLHAEQKKLVTGFLSEAKQKLKGLADNSASKEDINEGGLSLFRAFRGLPKNKALIKYLSEPGVKQILLKTEAFYMQDNSREMYKADEPLLFTIDEKNNQVDMTEKGIVYMSGNMEDENFFVMPDVATKIAEIDNSGKMEEEIIAEKQALMTDFSVKSERIHTINQLLKAYALFEKEVDYVVMDNKVKIVDEQTGRIMDGRRYSDGLHQAIESKESVKVEAATQTYATVTLQNFFRMYHKLAN